MSCFFEVAGSHFAANISKVDASKRNTQDDSDSRRFCRRQRKPYQVGA